MKENIGKNSLILTNKKITYINSLEEVNWIFECNKKYSISLMSSKPFIHEIEYLKSIF